MGKLFQIVGIKLDNVLWPEHMLLDGCFSFRTEDLPYQKYCTKAIQNLYKTLNLYIFCIQRLYKSKCSLIMNVQKMYIKFLYIYQKMYKLYKTCTKCILKMTWTLKYMFFVHTNTVNYTKPIQLANWTDLCMFFVHKNNVQTIQNVYKC